MPIPVERFIRAVMEDEGWMSPLSGDSVEAVVLALESRFPPEAQVDEAHAERLRASLRRLAFAVQERPAEEKALLAAWLSSEDVA